MQMIHLGITSIYMVIVIYYLFTPLLTLEQRLHATCISFLMMYAMVRSFKKINDLPVFFLMHWALYVIDGGRGVPFWMVVHVFTLFTNDLLHTAEQKIYTMVSELHRLHPSWQFDFMYTHDGLPRLTLTNAEQRQDNDLLHSFVDTRQNHEYPVNPTAEERTIWRLSDNKSILLDRHRRSFITSSLQIMTFCMYVFWWRHMIGRIHYYFFIDIALYLMLMTEWRIRLIAYHGVFACATFYLQFKLFNISLPSDNVVVH